MKTYTVKETYTVTEYEMDDYNAVKNSMSDKEAIALLNNIKRDYIPTYYYNGEEDDFENFKLHVAIQRGISAIEKTK